ncbi:serine/threonine-protein kinase pakF [Aplysia californica]|uniref:non-specific serine/threonine protein kinase n=1 Tax=Aplysia californica TaxID=6500 RepID=A0ABM1A7F8_APLCA|nr:serine/threonine-protein kinase pakF [Aplysia californica]
MGVELSLFKQGILSCSTCGRRLSNWYVENQGSLYCRRDYRNKFGQLCNGCSSLISGPVMVAGEHRYHPECFLCAACLTCIGDGEPYALLERSYLYCGQCYKSGHLTVRPKSVSLPPVGHPSTPSLARTSATTATTTKPTSLKRPEALPTTPTTPPPPSPTVVVTTAASTNATSPSSSLPSSSSATTPPPAPSSSSSTSSSLSTDTTPPRRKPHCIQMVEIPPAPDGGAPGRENLQQTAPAGSESVEQKSPTRHFHLALQTAGYRNSWMLDGGSRMSPCVQISELTADPALKVLEVGDRILEVNGSSIRDKTLEEISRLLVNQAVPVQVTVERDLSPLTVPDEDPFTSPVLPSKPLIRSTSGEPTSPGGSRAEGRTIVIQDTPVRLRPKASLKAQGHSPSRRRSKSPSPCPASRQKSIDLSRSHSFSTHKQEHRVFRTGDLIVGDVLGQGFFGKAIRVMHRITGEHMVLKELHNFDEDAQKSFLREVSMLRNLSHPCVLKFLGVLYRDKKLNLVTEFIDGGTLSDILLDTSRELSWMQRVSFAKDIATGMNYLHSMDIIHRDLNSQNCFVRKDQTVVVADFGLAKIVPRHGPLVSPTKSSKGDQESTGLAGSGRKKRFSRRKRQTVVGNPYWMAPEMMTKGVYDEKVDVFSYGIIVCETIARVTADPDYLPRSIDFGLNVESFHKRFCDGSPEPYVMLAVLCAHIEPDQRPSFEKVLVMCEALLLHVEHGMAVPQELQGSTVELYRRLKERLYGRDYLDGDSVTETNTADNKEVSLQQESNTANNKEASSQQESNTASSGKGSCTTSEQKMSSQQEMNTKDSQEPPQDEKAEGPSTRNKTKPEDSAKENSSSDLKQTESSEIVPSVDEKDGCDGKKDMCDERPKSEASEETAKPSSNQGGSAVCMASGVDAERSKRDICMLVTSNVMGEETERGNGSGEFCVEEKEAVSLKDSGVFSSSLSSSRKPSTEGGRKTDVRKDEQEREDTDMSQLVEKSCSPALDDTPVSMTMSAGGMMSLTSPQSAQSIIRDDFSSVESSPTLFLPHSPPQAIWEPATVSPCTGDVSRHKEKDHSSHHPLKLVLGDDSNNNNITTTTATTTSTTGLEDCAYFSCSSSSPSLSPSFSSFSPEDFATCTSWPGPSLMKCLDDSQVPSVHSVSLQEVSATGLSESPANRTYDSCISACSTSTSQSGGADLSPSVALSSLSFPSTSRFVSEAIHPTTCSSDDNKPTELSRAVGCKMAPLGNQDNQGSAATTAAPATTTSSVLILYGAETNESNTDCCDGVRDSTTDSTAASQSADNKTRHIFSDNSLSNTEKAENSESVSSTIADNLRLKIKEYKNGSSSAVTSPGNSENSDDSKSQNFLQNEVPSCLLSPNLGLSSSRRRLKKSLKSLPARDHSPFPL